MFRVSSKKAREEVYEETSAALSQLEMARFPHYGGRYWKCEATVAELEYPDRRLKQTKQGPLFRYYRGKLELACLPILLDQTSETPWGWTLDDESLGIKHGANSLEYRAHSEVTEASESDANFPTLDKIWISPQYDICRTLKSAISKANELQEKSKLINKIIYGQGNNGSLLAPRKATKLSMLTAGLYRFQRDGLWVVGQEESWHEGNMCERLKRKALGLDPATGKSKSLFGSKEGYKRPVEMFINAYKNKLASDRNEPMKIIQDHLRDVWRGMNKAEKQLWKDRPDDFVLPMSLTQTSQEDCVSSQKSCSPQHVSNFAEMPSGDIKVQAKKKSSAPNKMQATPESYVGHSCRVFYPKADVWYYAICTRYDCSSGLHTFVYNKSLPEEHLDISKSSIIWSHLNIHKNNKCSLTEKQVELCYDAVMEHYSRVMHTVRVRELQDELRDGFDVFRERGRNRFDMEIDSLNNFGFLTSLEEEKAPWLELVRIVLSNDVKKEEKKKQAKVCTENETLGNEKFGPDPSTETQKRIEIELVHKGSFLSLPGAEAQVYHQDGLHLTTKTQRPCHAVNVFIPLVDLTLKNGPTEFCLGTHILNQENFDKEFVDIPCVSAGTPILFDYRLGHRGLANTSDAPRPYVYLTYKLSSTTNWKDGKNFSRKRYRKFGDFCEIPLSREERSKRRLERNYERIKKECIILSKEQQENDDKDEKGKEVVASLSDTCLVVEGC